MKNDKRYYKRFAKAVAARLAKIYKSNPRLFESKDLESWIFTVSRWRVAGTTNVSHCGPLNPELWENVKDLAEKEFRKLVDVHA